MFLAAKLSLRTGQRLHYLATPEAEKELHRTNKFRTICDLNRFNLTGTVHGVEAGAR
jgi:hypothetical protein